MVITLLRVRDGFMVVVIWKKLILINILELYY